MKIGNLLERNSVIQYYNVATVYGLDDPSLFFMIVLFLALHESVETNQNQSHEKQASCQKQDKDTTFKYVIDILDILAQCNKSKLTPACTSSLGFSRLYILMSGFIVIHVIILHFYIIKMQPLRDSSVDVGQQD